MKKILGIVMLFCLLAVASSAQTNIGPPTDTSGSKFTNKYFGKGGQFMDSLIAKTKLILDQLRGNGTKLIGVNNTGTVIITSIDTSGYTQVTLTQMRAIMAAKTVRPGRIYNITNVDAGLYGGTSIFLVGTSDTTISQKGQGIFYNPRYNQAVTGYGIWNPYGSFSASSLSGKFTAGENVTANTGGIGTLLVSVGTGTTYFTPVSGTWSGATSITGNTSGRTATVASVTVPSYSIGATVIWGGKKWTNVNGNVGTATDIYTLDAEWSAVAYDRANYNIVSNDIEYNINDDKIISRKDRSDNEVTTNYWNNYDNSVNAIRAFQWGNDLDTNSYKGIGGNHVIDAYFENINFKGSSMRQVSLARGSKIQDNIFLSTSYMQQVTLGSNCSFSSNIITSNNGFFQITLDNGSGFTNNKLSGNSARIQNVTLNNGSTITSNVITNGSSFLYFNLDKLTTISTNNLNNTSFFRNIDASVASVSTNTLDNTTNINHIYADNGNVTSNNLDNSSTIDYIHLTTGSSVTGNRLDASSTLNYITLDNVSRIFQDTLNAGTIFRYGTMDRAANLQNATYSGASLISFSLHGANDINRVFRGLSGINVVMDDCIDIGNSKSLTVNNTMCKEVTISNKGTTGTETISNSILKQCTVDFAGFTGCTLDSVNAQGKTFTFTANNQTIKNESWLNNKRLDSLIAGTGISISRGPNGIYTITATGGGGGGSITTENALYIAKNGDDITGTRNRLDLPYLTIHGALADAVAGDVIVIFPGEYQETSTITLTPGINFEFIGRGRLLTPSSSDPLFNDAGSVTDNTIHAPYWTFTDNGDFQYIFQLTAASHVSVTVDSVTSFETCFRIGAGVGNPQTMLTVNANYIYSDQASEGTLSQLSGVSKINCTGRIENHSDGHTISIETGSAYITANEIFNTARGPSFSAVKTNNTQVSDSIFITANHIYSDSGTAWTVYFQGNSVCNFLRAQKVEGWGSCNVVAGGGTKVVAQVDEIHNKRRGGGVKPAARGLYNAEATAEMWAIATHMRCDSADGTWLYGANTGLLHIIAIEVTPDKVNMTGSSVLDRIDRYFKADTAAWFFGKRKYVDGTQGAGKILTSDANGVESWATNTVAGNASAYNVWWNNTGSAGPAGFHLLDTNAFSPWYTNVMASLAVNHVPNSSLQNSSITFNGTSVALGGTQKDTICIQFYINGGGSPITTGVKGYLEIPENCTILSCTMAADQVGSIVVHIYRDSYANYPPDASDAIYASAPPTISSAIKSQDNTLTGWSTACTGRYWLGYEVVSASTIQFCTISLYAVKN